MSDAEKVIFHEDENDMLQAKIKELESVINGYESPIFD